MCSGGAGRDHRMVWPFKSVFDRDLARRQIDQSGWDKEGAHFTWPILIEVDRGIVDALQSTDTRSDENAGALFVFIGFGNPSRILNRFSRCADRIENELIDSAAFFCARHCIWVERVRIIF